MKLKAIVLLKQSLFYSLKGVNFAAKKSGSADVKNVAPDQNTVRRIIIGLERTAKRRGLLKFDMNATLEMRVDVPGHRSNTQITNGDIPWL